MTSEEGVVWAVTIWGYGCNDQEQVVMTWGNNGSGAGSNDLRQY